MNVSHSTPVPPDSLYREFGAEKLSLRLLVCTIRTGLLQRWNAPFLNRYHSIDMNKIVLILHTVEL